MIWTHSNKQLSLQLTTANPGPFLGVTVAAEDHVFVLWKTNKGLLGPEGVNFKPPNDLLFGKVFVPASGTEGFQYLHHNIFSPLVFENFIGTIFFFLGKDDWILCSIFPHGLLS